ncbi:hypothetical protein GWA97_02875 [Flavobacterium sp. LaA7.5]|nr:hypothetical protein [Flavobacterium salilacus subsp. altitudinum]
MNISRIIINGIIIFIGIALFFLLMEVLNLTDQIYLRLFNFVFVIYGVNLTLKQNHKDRIYGYFTNISAAFLTAFVSLVVGIFSFVAYAGYKGGESYIDSHAEGYIFGGDPSLPQFAMGLLLEGVASSLIISFALMQIWKNRIERIDAIDDAAHNEH